MRARFAVCAPHKSTDATQQFPRGECSMTTGKNATRVHKLTGRLLHGTAIIGLAAMSATAAHAQSNDQQIETVVVTGTAIRGAAPVGANVITVDRDTIEATGATTVQQ